MGLQNEDVEPNAKIRGDHVHQSESGDQFVLVDVHLKKNVERFRENVSFKR